MNNIFKRTIALIGEDSFKKINESCVCVIGLGGVGSYVVEGLVRTGIGKLIIIDSAKVTISNLNRQIIATRETIGQYKTEAIVNRAKSINKEINIIKYNKYIDKDNIHDVLQGLSIDYIVDAIDSVSSKIEIIKYAKKNGISIISSMGTGNKVDATQFEITDISKTSVCPLARVMRKELKLLNIKNVDVIYSKELPKKVNNDEKIPASIAFVPSVAGLIISGYVINKIIENMV